MKGYDIRLVLYTHIETWRDVRIPGNLNFKQLHHLIQKIFGFNDYHMWDFNVPAEVNEEQVDLNQIIKTISYDEAENVNISKLFDEYDVLLYKYDFGDDWAIVISKLSENDYKNKTALILDYGGKYNPMDDMGGICVFEEVMESLDDDEELDYVLDSYGLTRADLSRMDFEKKYKKGSKIRII